MSHEKPIIRKGIVAGQFYPDRPDVLRHEVRTFLDHASSRPDPSVRGLIVPHAGYMYSGGIAAEAYRAIDGAQAEVIVVAAFLHRIFIQGVFIDKADFYETPLGRIPVNKTLAEKIRDASPYLADTIPGDLNEHSLEVQLPFLQMAVKDFTLLPVYIGEPSVANAEALSEALSRELAGKRALFVFSTDLSHFHPYKEAVDMDHKLIRMIGDRDVRRLERSNYAGEIEACGFGPVITSLFLAEKLGWEGPRLLKYANSGDITGEKGSVVGYAAMAYKVNPEA
ncbi:MAG TPA: AmmeMemoRadiSam system protein B [Candidatus Omnitrophota bacterium]|nr:AmmeMemoRadiSam system protein B [Candidatus Omnitrophota bacterium]HQB11356.1 AmmeMemoRadiSam system protein B [Candidatus Omnitrophota bacterium]